MAYPGRPPNPRVVYPDGSVIRIKALWYADTVDGTHIWVSEDPPSAHWVPGVRTTYDDFSDGHAQHLVIIGFDYEGSAHE